MQQNIYLCEDVTRMMTLFLRVFDCEVPRCMKKPCLPLELLLTLRARLLQNTCPKFYKYLEMGLQNFEEYRVCAITVGVVGDICEGHGG
ncbi:hypothetical protein IFM89_010720 [Coptis chinensis]|uniref:Uncharacterized protein n=1 Tax=Coptis chinensis TaxID=261450 RepID=A0A835ILL0_9MAGN|nr:hypothetical protein IFM89_010720 [Coptis chinensis]